MLICGGAISESRESEKQGQNLYFAPEDNGVSVSSSQLNYKLESEKNRANFSGVVFDAEQMYMRLEKLKPLDEISKNIFAIFFNWPTTLPNVVHLEVLSERGQTLFSQDVSEKLLADWQTHIKETTSGVAQKIRDSRWGLIDIDARDFKFLSSNQKFKACVSSTSTEFSFRSCTNLYHVEGSRLVASAVRQAAHISVDEKDYGDTVILNSPIGRILNFNIQFNNGVELKFSSGARTTKILDVSWNDDKSMVVVTGQGKKPIGMSLDISEERFWEPSFPLQKPTWKIQTPKDAPILSFDGFGEIPFSFLISFKDLPTTSDRIFILGEGSSSTYSDTAHFKISAPEAKSLQGDQLNLTPLAGKKEWAALMQTPAQENLAHIKVENETGKTWTANHYLYRGYPLELASKLEIAPNADSAVNAIGGIVGSYWAESIFGWQNYFLSKKRFGATIEYRRALTSSTTTVAGGSQSLQPTNEGQATIHYNLKPGVKNIDEIYGFNLDVYLLSTGSYSINLLGLGAYWSISLPNGFDKTLQQIHWLGNTHFFDIDLNYYPLSLSPNETTNGTFDFDVQMKSIYSDRFFWTLGVVFRSDAFKTNTNLASNAQASFQIYSTSARVGVGILF